MKILIKGYESTLEASYQQNIKNKTSSILCLLTRFNKQESENFNQRLQASLQSLNSNTLTLWIGPDAAQSIKLCELNLQLLLNWLVAASTSKIRWVIGASFAALLAVRIIIRRPEITNYILVTPVITDNNLVEIKLLTRLKTKGMIIIAERDTVSPISKVWQLMLFTNTLNACMSELVIVKRANHFFSNKLKIVSSLIKSFYLKSG
ncbi:Alpha/beta hydrolase [Candidatus Hodgkinia cicadicola]|nr:Alpha/beta hydrolase [Candidatus Hodgkinia cicadicola]